MPFSLTSRASGLLLHITSLPSPYGIGDMGPAAVAWIDRLAEAAKAGGSRCRLAPRVTATPRTSLSPRLPATVCSSVPTGSSKTDFCRQAMASILLSRRTQLITTPSSLSSTAYGKPPGRTSRPVSVLTFEPPMSTSEMTTPIGLRTTRSSGR